VYQRVPHFGRNDHATESEHPAKTWLFQEILFFSLPLRYKKGVQFCSRYMKGAPFWKKLVYYIEDITRRREDMNFIFEW